ncbi:MAG: hypothetical protein OEY18_14750 [Candidatus Aminicenantes bacterium]|nr:hypothetical protein [Candidatus Aminicenantes bacterium]MDH5385958.1 hypothetical protein [Candidatus Aminicenantes bacterium]MDH5743957.1 hypothetical protein [Candidatus Aminicenantes bacterium]
MLRKTAAVFIALVLTIISIQCKKKSQVQGISLEVTFSEEKLTDYLITDVQYKWKTGSDFQKMGQDMNVFVHFWHNRNLLFQDDHIPEVPVPDWEPGKEYTYSRRIFIPEFIDEFDPEFKGEETLRLSIGFFSPYDRTDKSKQEVLERKLKVYPPPLDTPEIIYEDGWYDLEINQEAFLERWRWTAKEAHCIIDNPKRDALLVIKGGINLEVLKDQKVLFMINDRILDEFIPEESYFEKSYTINKEMLGESDEFFLTIATDKTFVPSQLIPNSNDERELGIQISFIYFR